MSLNTDKYYWKRPAHLLSWTTDYKTGIRKPATWLPLEVSILPFWCKLYISTEQNTASNNFITPVIYSLVFLHIFWKWHHICLRLKYSGSILTLVKVYLLRYYVERCRTYSFYTQPFFTLNLVTTHCKYIFANASLQFKYNAKKSWADTKCCSLERKPQEGQHSVRFLAWGQSFRSKVLTLSWI